MTQLCFVRHGLSVWNKENKIQGHQNVPLSQEGIEQAKKVGQRLSQERWDALYSSDLQRAHLTAEHIATALGLSKAHINLDPRLRERYFGQFEGTTERERIEKWGPNWRSYASDIETDANLVARGIQFVQEIATKHPFQSVLIVSHGSFLRQTLSKLLNEPLLPLANTAVTKVIKKETSWTCVLYNCVSHLSSR